MEKKLVFNVFLYLCGTLENEKSLNKQRYKLFTKCVTKNKINLVSLPLTEEAVRQHSYRVYLQAQTGKGFVKKVEIRSIDNTHLPPMGKPRGTEKPGNQERINGKNNGEKPWNNMNPNNGQGKLVTTGFRPPRSTVADVAELLLDKAQVAMMCARRLMGRAGGVPVWEEMMDAWRKRRPGP
ncbi:Hypothetical protein CINCED_3A014912 [Cinara cedri]|uniref:Uncharacterized protein n=1 Tax=Cinara cedri TaxID=506608 RepID=A0A5E4MXU6_9HEMI|nr:Hypothetical protein CINCED_3A014912 [Cinara cedri]